VTYEPIKGSSGRYFGILAPIEYLLLLGLMPLLPRQYLFRRVEEGGAVALEVLNRWFFQDALHRYDFRDIQAITLRRSRAGFWMSIGLVLFSSFFGVLLALAMAYQLPMISQTLLTIFTACAGALLLFNLARGATCVCEIHTRVNKERFHALGRWNHARPVLEALVRDIEAVQGTVETPPESGLVECAQNSVPAAQLERIRQTPTPAMGCHKLFFALLVVMAASSALDLFMYSEWKNLGDMTLYGVLLLTGSLALMRQRYDGVARPPFFHPTARHCAIGGLAALLAIYYVFQMLQTIETMANSNPEDLMGGLVMRPGQLSVAAISVLNILILTPLGVFGLWGIANRPKYDIERSESHSTPEQG